jgi:hypothetical protein
VGTLTEHHTFKPSKTVIPDFDKEQAKTLRDVYASRKVKVKTNNEIVFCVNCFDLFLTL